MNGKYRGGFAVQFLGVSVMLQIDQTPFIYAPYNQTGVLRFYNIFCQRE